MQFIWLLLYFFEDSMLEFFENSISKLEMDWTKNIKIKLNKIDNIEILIKSSKEIQLVLKECKEFENIKWKKLETIDSLSKD